MEILHDWVLKFSKYVKICVRKDPNQKVCSEEGWNIFRTLLFKNLKNKGDKLGLSWAKLSTKFRLSSIKVVFHGGSLPLG